MPQDQCLVPGCWIMSRRFGKAVLISIKDDHYTLRYEATHLLSQETIWVLNGDSEVTPCQPADALSKHVLGLEGPYGLGKGRSDPRMP